MNKGNYCKASTSNEENDVNKANGGVAESNRFSALESLVEETVLVPPIDDRRIVEEAISMKIELNG